MILLDTQTLVWRHTGDRRLGPRARSMIESRWKRRQVAVSALSFWEISMNRDARDFRRLPDIRVWRNDLLKDGLVEVPVDGEIAIAAGQISGMHGDPGDRIIMATALRTELLITSDQRILDWYGQLARLDAFE